MQMTFIRGCIYNFSLLSQLLGPNAVCTKFGVKKCRIAPPLSFFLKINALIWFVYNCKRLKSYKNVGEFSKYPLNLIYFMFLTHIKFKSLQGQDIYSLDRMERPPSPPGQNIFNLEGGGGGGGGGAQVYECEPMKWACVNCTYFNYSRQVILC